MADGQKTRPDRVRQFRYARSARKECAERLFIVSLSQTGGSRVTNLGRPAYPRSKGTGDHNMPEKWSEATSPSPSFRKPRVSRSKLHSSKPNPVRDKGGPAATLTQRG